MRLDSIHQPFAEAPASVLLEHINITKVSESRPVRDNPSQADLTRPIEQAKTKGAFNRLRNDVARNALGPIGPGKILVHGLNIQPGRIGRNAKILSSSLKRNHGYSFISVGPTGRIASVHRFAASSHSAGSPTLAKAQLFHHSRQNHQLSIAQR